jgi:hypothetical protein
MQRRSCLQLSGLVGPQFGRHEQVQLSVMPGIAATEERVCAAQESASVLASRDGLSGCRAAILTRLQRGAGQPSLIYVPAILARSSA